jgi:hypothetical protein
VQAEDVPLQRGVRAGRRPGVGLQGLGPQREQLPAADADVGLEQGVAGGGALRGVGAIVNAAQPFQLLGPVLGQVRGIRDDQGVRADQGRGVGQQAVGQGGDVPVLTAEVAAEALLGAVDVRGAAAEGPSDLAEVDVVGEDQAGDQVRDEAAPAGVGEGPCQPAGEGVQSPADQGRDASSRQRWASFRLGKCMSRREEAFCLPLSRPRHWVNSNRGGCVA